jgi:hypothetical protein
MPLAACTMQGEGRSANPCTNTPCTRSSFRSGRHSNGSNLVTYYVRIARNRSIKQPRGAYVLDHTCDTVLERETRSIAGFRMYACYVILSTSLIADPASPLARSDLKSHFKAFHVRTIRKVGIAKSQVVTVT